MNVLNYLAVALAVVAFDHTHSSWSALLEKHAPHGYVNYQSFADDRALLQSYLDGAARVKSSEYSAWSRDQKLAFWINLYNASTVRSVLDCYPVATSSCDRSEKGASVQSIRQISNVWTRKTLDAAGLRLSLDDVEHGILRHQEKQTQDLPKWLREKFDEPRIHFALNCAAVSCPLLAPKAFIAETLDEQLESATRKYVSAPGNVVIDSTKKTISLPQIFNWYTDDFSTYSSKGPFKKGSKRALLNFVYRYLPDAERDKLKGASQFKVTYLGYDWRLNSAIANQ